jgi:Peptidase M15
MTFPEDPISALEAESSLIARRGALTTLGLAGLGLLASAATSQAFTASKKSGAMPKVSVPTSNRSTAPAPGPAVRYVQPAATDLPDEWMQMHGRGASDYLRYLKSLNLRRVNADQVLASHAKSKGGVWNSLPPKQWWNRMGYTLRVVERIAQELNVTEVEVISAYRSPSYNSRCAGARTGSWHQANVAVDVKLPVRASSVTKTARELRDLGLFRGGVGGYWNFTHIDARGKNINW